MTNDQIIDAILRREGSAYTNRKSDRGGPTKYGITQKSWEPHRDRLAKRGDWPSLHVCDLTESEARLFYISEHVAPFAWLKDDNLRELLVDCSVNHGTRRATIWLQQAAGVKADGVIGPVTRAAVKPRAETFGDYSNHLRLHRDVLRTRFKFYATIASDQLPADPDLPNLRGWINRACEFIR